MDKNKVRLLIFFSRTKEQVKTSNGKTWSRGTNSHFAVFRIRDF